MSIFGVFSAKRFLDITLPWQHLRSQVIKNYLKGCVIYKNSKSQSFSFLDLTVSELYSKNQLGGGANLPPPVQNRVNNVQQGQPCVGSFSNSTLCNPSGQSYRLTNWMMFLCGQIQAQGPTSCPTEERAFRGPRDLWLPV